MRALFAVLVALFLFACTDKTSSGPENREDERLYGWRWDDFKPVPDPSKMYGGLRRIFHVNGWIVLRDDYYSSNEYTSPGKITTTPRVFASKIGSTFAHAADVAFETVVFVDDLEACLLEERLEGRHGNV